ncbi:hypothetical protein JTE90_027951 [Oedothorax gibbosus]|uniref:Uncharacterized protein n=1 Tax=Oedothorax gibbosus TaxID=931172 RepID=A0AAV6VGJ1_9ARAC|nr:hypothetical protein JTE90_027951 [Oedothorax gibbosus]
MAKKGEVFWEVGKQLPKETWDKAWSRGEFVESPKFTMPGICTLHIFFYPGGMSDSDYPKFKLVRSDATLKSSKIRGEVQFLHGDTLAARFVFKEKFERGNTDYVHGFQDFQDLRRLRIFHSLPELGYRYIYTVSEPDPNETVPEPDANETMHEPDPNETVAESDPNETVPETDPHETEPEPGIITSAIDFVCSGIGSARSYLSGWGS